MLGRHASPATMKSGGRGRTPVLVQQPDTVRERRIIMQACMAAFMWRVSAADAHLHLSFRGLLRQPVTAMNFQPAAAATGLDEEAPDCLGRLRAVECRDSRGLVPV